RSRLGVILGLGRSRLGSSLTRRETEWTPRLYLAGSRGRLLDRRLSRGLDTAGGLNLIRLALVLVALVHRGLTLIRSSLKGLALIGLTLVLVGLPLVRSSLEGLALIRLPLLWLTLVPGGLPLVGPSLIGLALVRRGLIRRRAVKCRRVIRLILTGRRRGMGAVAGPVDRPG